MHGGSRFGRRNGHSKLSNWLFGRLKVFFIVVVIPFEKLAGCFLRLSRRHWWGRKIWFLDSPTTIILFLIVITLVP